MGDYVCLFKVLVWDELDKENKVEQGFCFANTFAEAAEWLEKTWREQSNGFRNFCWRRLYFN